MSDNTKTPCRMNIHVRGMGGRCSKCGTQLTEIPMPDRPDMLYRVSCSCGWGDRVAYVDRGEAEADHARHRRFTGVLQDPHRATITSELPEPRCWTLVAQMRPKGAEGHAVVINGPTIPLYERVEVVAIADAIRWLEMHVGYFGVHEPEGDALVEAFKERFGGENA